MRLRMALLVLCALALSHAQVWEKHIAPGLVYRMEAGTGVPRLVHALRFSLGTAAVRATPELAELKVYSDTPFRGREPIGALVQRAGALGGVNADFFPPTGDPLGLMVRNGELLSLPHPDRTVFAWGPAAVSVGKATSSFALTPEGGEPIAIDGFNQECGPNEICLFSESAGLAPAPPPAVRVVLDVGRGTLSPSGKAEGTVRSVSSADGDSVPPGSLVVVATGAKAAAVRGLKRGQRVTLEWSVAGLQWDKLPNAVGGGPLLLRDGKGQIGGEAEGFSKAFVASRHPRTAVGRTPDGDVWFVAVDGRQPMSVGATLSELASIMKGLGCVDAVNLDGGGSTTIHLLGVTLNRPSDGQERAVANGVLFYGTPPLPDTRQLRLAVPPKLVVGESPTLKVFGADGEPIPNTDVLWGAQGKGWIDQGGLLRTLGEGKIEVRAYARGQLLTATLDVKPKG